MSGTQCTFHIEEREPVNVNPGEFYNDTCANMMFYRCNIFIEAMRDA